MIDNIFLQLNKFVPEKWRWILEHEGFKKYFKNTGWMFFAQGFSVFSLFVNIWVARYLGPNDFGRLSYALAFAGIFSFISSLGVGSILVRELVKYPEKRDNLLGTAFVLLLSGGLIAFLITSVIAFLIVDEFIIQILIVIFSLTFIISSLNVIYYYFQANVRAKENIYPQVITTILTSLLKIILILSGKGIIWLMLTYVAECLIKGIFFIITYYKFNLHILKWKFDISLAIEMLSVSWLLMLSSAAALIYMKIDQVMIGSYLGSSAVGLYAGAVRLVEIWYFIPTIICGSLFPAIVNGKIMGTDSYHKRLKGLYLLLGGVAVLIAIPSVILAPWFINLFYGQAYLGSVEILRIYIWSGIGLFLMWGVNQYLLTENKLYSLFFLSLFSLIINVVLNLIFIPQFGITGAAWATLISYSVGPVVVYLIYVLRK